MNTKLESAWSSQALKPIQDCRFCAQPLQDLCIDLGVSPLCESWLAASDLNKMEPFYPLHVYVCRHCHLVQVNAYVSGEQIFGGDYAYFSSFSDSWLAHAQQYVQSAIERWKLGKSSQVIEVASNDGYLLQYFVKAGIPVLGIEPAVNCAAAAKEKGVPSLCRFFSSKTATELCQQGIQADLLLGNNVLAHVPDLNDFVAGLKILLAKDGVCTLEIGYIVTMIEGNQFDSIYQEHYCYFSLLSIERVLAAHELTVFDVEVLPTHGGSLRIYAKHTADSSKLVNRSVVALRMQEQAKGYTDLEVYRGFGQTAVRAKHQLLKMLIELRRAGKQVVGYGAPGKSATLLNFCGIREDLIEYTVDRNPYKHGRFMPGVRIPVFPIDKIRETRPDYVVILPWNLKDEIMRQLDYIGQWGGKFILPIPEATILEPISEPSPPIRDRG